MDRVKIRSPIPVIDLTAAIRISPLLEVLTQAPPCGRPEPGSEDERRALDTTFSCRRGQGGRADCRYCETEALLDAALNQEGS